MVLKRKCFFLDDFKKKVYFPLCLNIFIDENIFFLMFLNFVFKVNFLDQT